MNYKKQPFSALNIFNINLHLPSRIDFLEITLNEIDSDVIVLCELKMKSSEIKRINLKGYLVKSFYARSVSMGGGVIILFKSQPMT